MSKLPWVKFYPGDWIAGTSQLMAVERGIYISLLAHMYDTGGPLKYEPKRLSMICGCSRQQLVKTVELLLQDPGKLRLEDNFLTNERVKIEQKNAKKLSQTASKNAQSRWKKTNENNEGAMQSHDSGIAPAYASQNIEKRKYSETSSLRTKEKPPGDADDEQDDPPIPADPKPKKNRGSRLDPGWTPGRDGAAFARSKGMTNEQIKHEFDKFQAYWLSASGQRASKVSWMRTWQGWVLRCIERYGTNGAIQRSNPPISQSRAEPSARLRGAMRAAIPPDERG